MKISNNQDGKKDRLLEIVSNTDRRHHISNKLSPCFSKILNKLKLEDEAKELEKFKMCVNKLIPLKVDNGFITERDRTSPVIHPIETKLKLLSSRQMISSKLFKSKRYNSQRDVTKNIARNKGLHRSLPRYLFQSNVANELREKLCMSPLKTPMKKFMLKSPQAGIFSDKKYNRPKLLPHITPHADDITSMMQSKKESLKVTGNNYAFLIASVMLDPSLS